MNQPTLNVTAVITDARKVRATKLGMRNAPDDTYLDWQTGGELAERHTLATLLGWLPRAEAAEVKILRHAIYKRRAALCALAGGEGSLYDTEELKNLISADEARSELNGLQLTRKQLDSLYHDQPEHGTDGIRHKPADYYRALRSAASELTVPQIDQCLDHIRNSAVRNFLLEARDMRAGVLQAVTGSNAAVGIVDPDDGFMGFHGHVPFLTPSRPDEVAWLQSHRRQDAYVTA